MELLQHSSHEHPLVLIQVHSPKIEEVEEENGSPKSEDEDDSSSETEAEEAAAAWCFGCGEQVEGPSYSCNSGCKFFLHKSCAELEFGSEINPPIHPHPLFLLPKSPCTQGELCYCSSCGDPCYGFVFHCKACDFFLDIKCASLKVTLQHFSHKDHPLLLYENHKFKLFYGCCAACKVQIPDSDAFYRCLECGDFYLHKQCAELPPEISYPFHPHPLSLLPKHPLPKGFVYVCSICSRICYGFVYHCWDCCFGLDVFCGVFELSTIREYPKLQHFSHEHQLLLIDVKRIWYFPYCCVACEGRSFCTSIYRCIDCPQFVLHKECAEQLPLEINHPFHRPHPLILVAQSPCFEMREGVRVNVCRFCHGASTGFVYRCDSCNLDLDLQCSLLELHTAGDFHKLEHFSHEHPLILNEKYNKDDNSRCCGCWKPVLSGSFYRCVDCSNFDLHKECAELPLKINHPYHRKHPLTLLPNPPIHPEKCSCYWCKVQYKGFFYYCSSCMFGLNPENVSLPRMITDASHEHPWILLSACVSFICNFCGTDGECAPYVCSTCDRLVHKNCISLPQKVKTTRHHHTISHAYFLQPKQSERVECRICHDEVNTEYGSYCCSASNCNYVAHVKCATDNVSEDQDESPEESLSLISDVIEKVTVGEDEIATKIKHVYHEHYLIMTFVGEVKDDSVCNGCMRNISVPFYSCKECGFFLHRLCAELPRVKQVAIHKHRLTLIKYSNTSKYDVCVACSRFHHGFSYTCDRPSCNFKIDLQCSLLSDSLIHPSHQHKLLLTQEYEGNCSGCNKKNNLVYRCKERCGFALCFECITLPPTTWYKLDRHPLFLAYNDDSEQSQLCCDMCEEVRNREDWFYYCADCNNSVHIECLLGDLPFIKVGSMAIFRNHQHIVKYVRNVWNSPPCHVCAKLCTGQALECIDSVCNHIFHFKCIGD